jgi:chromatin assembly factor 1 subunit A
MRRKVDDARRNDGVSAGVGESTGSRRPESTTPVAVPLPRVDAPRASTTATDSPKVSFEEFAAQHRRRQHADTQRRDLEHRLHAARVFICLSARLMRVSATAQRGLVEAFKHGDKSSFVTIYNAVREIHEFSDSVFRRDIHRQDPLEDSPLSPDPGKSRPPGFIHQLSPKIRTDLLQILSLVRTDSQFLFERISSLHPSQLSALASSITSIEVGDPAFSAASRFRNQSLFSKRGSSTQSVLFKDHALSFERTDPLSILLFNVFATPLDWNPAEAQLRLDVWSSTCAKLFSHGDLKFYPLVGHVLSYWAVCSDWKAKPKFELYLMDVLQKGAFLLENIQSPIIHNLGAELPDPLRTDAAEEFFEFAVQALFEILDDSDAGLPSAVLEFGNAVLGKLTLPGSHERFQEFIFAHWFFSIFLHNALSFPEAHGLLLDFHIGKDAREKLLGQIGLRAQSQVFRVLRSLPQFSKAHLKVRQHVDRMLSRLTGFNPSSAPELRYAMDVRSTTSTTHSRTSPAQPSLPVILSSADIITLLNALFPKPHFPSCDSSSTPSCPSMVVNAKRPPQQPQRNRSSRLFEPTCFPGRINTLSGQSPVPGNRSFFSTLSRNADLIRFELSDVGESEDRPALDHPSTEDWVTFYVSADGKSLGWTSSYEDESRVHVSLPGDGSEENREALQAAIVKLVESETPYRSVYGPPFRSQQLHRLSLKHRFDGARAACERLSDFVGAHYWWTASKQLDRTTPRLRQPPLDDSRVLGPMLNACTRSLAQSNRVIKDCEGHFVLLNPAIEQMQVMLKGLMTGLAKLRSKMWYMTDVKNSMRYEDAKNVALALKTMVYPASIYKQPGNEFRPRNGMRSLASSFLQKPEMQVMNVMKAPTSQGGPNKLSDEQVELTRKWLTHHGIENFCKGEERIHRFCYEVKSSISKLVGDTMAETPVLWASELFQEERAKFESPTNRGFHGISPSANLRPSSIASEDSIYTPQFLGSGLRPAEPLFRPSQHEIPSLMRKSSFQSLSSDKWKTSRNPDGGDASSIWDSPGRATSSSTADSCSTFWSPAHTQAHSATSASSFQSRPPSMLSEAPVIRRNDRHMQGKAAFLDDLRQTLTSLLLSDLGSPVWSCGSETDAWFTNFLNRKIVQAQMDKRAKIQRFLTECDSTSSRRMSRSASTSKYPHHRCQSAGPVLSRGREPPTNYHAQDTTQQSSFEYHSAFRQLMEVFSRHANPFVKLKALRDLRALVLASLNSSSEFRSAAEGNNTGGKANAMDIDRDRTARQSFSEAWSIRSPDEESLQTPTSLSPESIDFDSRQSYSLGPSESQVINAMKSLLREIQPKTLFRDLQFVSTFVPSETLNKTDTGTAFLHFGLAALSLKDDVCDSMVEIADSIVSQELNRRHPYQAYDMSQRLGSAIDEAAGMWIITAKEGNAVAQRELAILYLTHPEHLPRVTLPLTLPRDTFKAEMMYRRDKDSKTDPQSMCLALHWMQLSANGGDELARNRLREREEFDSIA